MFLTGSVVFCSRLSARWTRHFDVSFEPCVSPYKGYLYANLGGGGPGGQSDGGYAVIEAATGDVLPRHVNTGWGIYQASWGHLRTGRSYVPTTVAGRFVFCGDSGEGFGGKHLSQANFTVVEAKPQGRIVAQNGLPARSNNALAFDEDRIYYRTTTALMCLACTGEEGKAYEAEVNARTLMEDLPTEAPKVVKAVRFIRRTDNPGIQAWLGGAPLRHGHRYRLAEGEYTLLAEMSTDTDLEAEDMCLDFHFLPSADDPKKDVETYRNMMRSMKPYLDRVVKLKPGSDTAKRAREFLAKIQ